MSMDVTAVDIAPTQTEMNYAYQRLHNEHVAEHGCSPFGCADIKVLNEAYRQWHVRAVARRDGSRAPRDPSQPRPQKAPRTKLHEILAKPNDDGTITCAGPCGETKPVKKFPTVKGGIGRANTCRECRDAAIAERKAASRG